MVDLQPHKLSSFVFAGEKSFLESELSRQLTSTDSSGKHGGEEMCSSSKRFKFDNSGMRGKFPVISEDAEAPSSEEEEEEEEEEGGDGVMAHVNQFFAELHVDQSRQRRRLLEGRAVKVRLARPAPSSLCKRVWLAKLSQCKLSVAF